jgi:hypothetical protein
MEPESDDESTEPKRIAEDSEESNASDYQAEDVKDESSESANEEDNASNEEEEEKRVTPKRRPEKRKSLPSRNKDSNEKELWKSGAKLTPGTQVIIKKPKPRDAGDTPYTNDTIHPNTMLFLKDLAANNDRQWLKRKSTASICDIYRHRPANGRYWGCIAVAPRDSMLCTSD